jgi:hypothetical protein
MNAHVPLDQQVFEQHVKTPAFKLGCRDGRWAVLNETWPKVTIRVFARAISGLPDYYDLRFDCSGYPNDPPTAVLWDTLANKTLPFAQWPAGRHMIPSIFNPGWEGGAALYLPCDRRAIKGHDQWRTQYPNWIWKPAVGIILYLRIVHELLNSEDYTSVRGS